MITALILDFDGLIIDTETPDYQSWLEVYHTMGAELPLAVWAECIGRAWSSFDPLEYLERQLEALPNRDEIRVLRHQRYLEMVDVQPVLPGVLDYIDQAHGSGMQVAIASSSPHRWVDRHLEIRGINELFDVIICAEDAENSKPAPDLYLTTLSALGISATDAIAFEDSPNGITSARTAGIYCVAVPNPMTVNLLLAHANRLIPSLAAIGLIELMAQIFPPASCR